jgi:hypothetical protein
MIKLEHKFWKCLLLFSSETVIIASSFHKTKDYSFANCFVVKCGLLQRRKNLNYKHFGKYFDLDEVSGQFKILHKEKLHDLYTSPPIVRILKLRITVG